MQERRQIRCEVVVDALGSFSPISAQARKGRKPDSVVMLVGACAQGLPATSSADLLWSFTPINRYDAPLAPCFDAVPCRMGLARSDSLSMLGPCCSSSQNRDQSWPPPCSWQGARLSLTCGTCLVMISQASGLASACSSDLLPGHRACVATPGPDYSSCLPGSCR